MIESSISPPSQLPLFKVAQQFSVCLTLLMGVVGCGASDGPAMGTVTGAVTQGGKPVEGVTVQFQPEEGTPSFGTTDSDGQYELAYVGSEMGAQVGTHTVQLTYTGEDINGDPLPGDVRIPREFGPSGSEMREVEPGQNTIDFELAQS